MSDSGSNPTTIDDLDDNMLTQILFRLPSSAPIVVCKLVNKHWCCLISDPKFGAHFSNHKKESSTLSKLCSNVHGHEPQCSFIPKWFDVSVDTPAFSVGNTSNNEAAFGSPKLFPMGCLPCSVEIKATFKDLVLCSGPRTRVDEVSYITNPVTNQWVALPPRPVLSSECEGWRPWVGLVCQEPYEYTQDYKFRVVVIDQCPPPVYGLLVYCSEICEWKKFNLGVSINPELAANLRGYSNNKFQGVVCKGIIYLHHMSYFAAFNPFDVDDTTHTTTIEAKVLPSLPDPVDGYLLESSGQLFIMYNPNKKQYDDVCYQKHGAAIELSLMIWKLDPNQVPLIWKMTFQGLCTGNVNQIKPPLPNESIYDDSVLCLGMEPNNDKLIYMHLYKEQQLVLCDTQTRLIKPLKTLPQYNLLKFDRLELQWWPTLVPKAYLSNTSH